MDRKTEKENILQFNPANATREQICLWLYTIINCELEKPQEIRDEELIQECSDFDALLFEAEDNLSDAEIEMRISRIKEKALVLSSSNQTIVKNKVKRKRPFKIIGVIAAALILITLSINIVAAFYGMSGIEFIRSNIDKLKQMEDGTSLEGDGITLIKNGEKVKYKTIEEAIIEAELNIMYPSLLPEGVQIIQVEQLFIGVDNQYLVMFKTNSDIYMTAKNYNITDVKFFDGHEIYEINTNTFYITTKESLYIATCQQDNIEYYIQCNNKEDLKLIMNNMKGFKK